MTRIRRALTGSVMAGSLVAAGLGAAGTADSQPVVPADLASLFDAGSLGGFGGFGSIGNRTADAPRLSSVPNFRDVAGTGDGYVGAGGTHLNKGVFYRANAIAPDDGDLNVLQGLNISVVYDLRTDEEVHDKPDRRPAGSAYVRVPMAAGNVNELIEKMKSPEDARNLMREMNRSFVTGESDRAAFKTLLTDLAAADGSQLFHCTAGKDRTGWTSMLLQSIAGVDDATIMNDYLLTNEYNAEWAAANRAYIVSTQGEQVAQLFDPLLGVEADYLQAGLDQIQATYGSVEQYIAVGLGLNAETIQALEGKLLG
ncbi:tyrosine-protein phosphatase [Rhodococcus sp. NPDC127528]|uniref:tyrosine-protein phosphatase n=1 Tax=unclassified Rhodococcus (in: high G+C Gram-positive bacteria) TaxID=192944 RepID=UPI0036389F73